MLASFVLFFCISNLHWGSVDDPRMSRGNGRRRRTRRMGEWERSLAVSLSSFMLPNLLTEDFGSFRVLLAFYLQVELSRTVCVKRIEAIRGRRLVPPVLIDPEPMI